MKVKEVLKLLKDDGWFIARTRGDHRQLKHPSKKGLVTVSGKLSDEIKKGTLGSIRRQAGL
jgi:predicted RNA binding protein YcfA (HicA-like mRNA interferase family)